METDGANHDIKKFKCSQSAETDQRNAPEKRADRPMRDQGNIGTQKVVW